MIVRVGVAWFTAEISLSVTRPRWRASFATFRSSSMLFGSAPSHGNASDSAALLTLNIGIGQSAAQLLKLALSKRRAAMEVEHLQVLEAVQWSQVGQLGATAKVKSLQLDQPAYRSDVGEVRTVV